MADSGAKFIHLRVSHLMLEGKGLTIPSVFNPALPDLEEPSLVLLPDKRRPAPQGSVPHPA